MLRGGPGHDLLSRELPDPRHRHRRGRRFVGARENPRLGGRDQDGHRLSAGSGLRQLQLGVRSLLHGRGRRCVLRRPRWISAHSIYFKVLGESGFIGFFLLLGIIGTNFRDNRLSLRFAIEHPDKSAIEDRWPALLNVGLVGFAVAGAFLGGLGLSASLLAVWARGRVPPHDGGSDRPSAPPEPVRSPAPSRGRSRDSPEARHRPDARARP